MKIITSLRNVDRKSSFGIKKSWNFVMKISLMDVKRKMEIENEINLH